jgi:hypothetical protein
MRTNFKECRRLKKEKFSITIDETTDIATKSLVINCRFYNEDQRKIKDNFAELVE